jgi:hypothetical protein
MEENYFKGINKISTNFKLGCHFDPNNMTDMLFIVNLKLEILVTKDMSSDN